MTTFHLNRCLSGFLKYTSKRTPISVLSRSFSSSDTLRKDDNSQLFDVVISGGGMVGAAMACALGHANVFEDKKILLLEASPQKDFKLPEKYGNRVCALSPATKKLLSGFGAWEEICNMRYQPVKRMQVWDACSDAFITLNHDDMTDDVAYIVENDVILAAIMKQFDKIKHNVTVMYNSKAEMYTFPSQIQDGVQENLWIKVHLPDGETFQTKLLIGADGFNSLVRKQANIHTLQWDYEQWGLVSTLHFAEPTENVVAWQRFLPTGPVAVLPLSETQSSLVWTTSPDEAKRLLKLPKENFVDALNMALWDEDKKDSFAVRAGQVAQDLINTVSPEGTSFRQLPPTFTDIEDESRAAFPLSLVHASHYVKPRLALIGDAAHRVHPLAGQGVNLGFGDVTCLRDVLVQCLCNGGDLGSLSHLLQYETSRQRKVLPVMFAMDGLKRLYGTDFPPVVVLRTLGLQATNSMKSLKDFFVTQATN
ncbi:ubiquinone biosynthesis monooxygenase COQ6, mitochondrial [Lingula anatina]|uniref:Ubiquinone biosynthesis monooxygenase COQ6, mitochondrial n=1 Tax=Lingula anatina TaxID=7574 RepID=A0A1S3IS81_LINAN|nr:ubiquinone biosynthesis monooxygenase COQ6, mitochondrial [Lingula anatina]|eukprot:XP_013400796.1 ubiquinone biosynthesis monooxygenase COQ6, mitochondrial [Lingula anatina]